MKSLKSSQKIGRLECLAFHEENSILVISSDQLISLSEVATEIKIESVVSAVRNIVKKSLGWQHKRIHH